MDLSVVVVSWNVRELLLRCLASVYAQLGDDREGEVFVVDNASGDGSAEAVATTFPRTNLIVNVENVGFVRANNQALARCRGRYVLLLNPDTVVGEGALARLVDAADADPRVAAAGPMLLYPDGAVQPSRRRFPTLGTALVESTVLQRLPIGAGLRRRFYVADRPHDEEQDVDWLVGACLLVRRAAIEQVGLLDERFFMYSEELDWCRRLRQAGWRVRYVPTAKVVHYEARSSEQVPVARHVHFHESRCRYFGKYEGRLAERVLRASVVANYAFMALEEQAKLLLGHKPDLRRQRVRTYGEVARWHLRRLLKNEDTTAGRSVC